jgi:hypothetical protein
MFNQTVDTFGENTFEIALARTATCISCHHPGNWGIGAQQRSKFCRGIELSREHRLEHGQEKMFFSAFVLVTIQSEHDGLKESVDFSEANKAAKGGNMARFGLEEEKKIGVLLKSAFIRELAFGRIHFLEMLLNFTLLISWMNFGLLRRGGGETYFIESHAILNEESYPLIKVTNITLQDEILLGLR